MVDGGWYLLQWEKTTASLYFFPHAFALFCLRKWAFRNPCVLRRGGSTNNVMKKIGMIEKDDLKREEMLNKPLRHMQELSTESCEMINGGSQSFLYWIAFGAGWVADKLGGLGG